MELSKEELIAMQEMMEFVNPTTKEEAILKSSIAQKISSVVGTPESRKAEQEKMKHEAAIKAYNESSTHLNKCLDALDSYFEKKGIVLESDGPVFLTDVKTGLCIQVA